jgi:UDP-glucose 4-epimerase
MTKILVTGGAGFIGSSLVGALVNSSKNYEITVYDNLSTGKIENISDWLSKPNFKFIQADMLDVSSLEEAVSLNDIVFHLAANSSVQIGEVNTKIDFEQNLFATFNLLEAMRKSDHCKKMIFTSTSTVYGEVNDMPIPEKYSPLNPISLYGASKLACEALISGYCHMFHMSSKIARLANIIGPISTQGVIHDFILKLSGSISHLDILGNGEQKKSYLHIDDCIHAILRLFEKIEKEPIDTFNVGSEDAITVSNIADLVTEELGLNHVERRFIDEHDGAGWNGDVRDYLLDSSKMKGIGWNAKYNSKDAVIQTARGYLGKD